jgi:hypothetical protein
VKNRLSIELCVRNNPALQIWRRQAIVKNVNTTLRSEAMLAAFEYHIAQMPPMVKIHLDWPLYVWNLDTALVNNRVDVVLAPSLVLKTVC